MATIIRPKVVPLGKRPDMITVMREDLEKRLVAAVTTHDVPIYGVFSIDDLERQVADDLCGSSGGHAFGVMYMGANGVDRATKGLNTDSRTNAAQMQEYYFGIVMASPANAKKNCVGDVSTELLSVVRQAVLGTQVEGAQEVRTWNFVREGPEINASTEQVLYYLQVWRLVLAGQGNF